MAPGSGKRKRPDRQFSNDDSRPSPHRPESLAMAQHNQGSPRGWGRGGGRGGRGNRSTSNIASNHDARSATPQPKVEEESQPQSQKQVQAPTQPTSIVYRAPDLPQEDDPRQAPAPYDYEYLTDEVISTWRESGRQSVLERVLTQDVIRISILIQELVRAGLDKTLAASEAGDTVRELIAKNEDHEQVESLFIDTISLLDEKDQKRASLVIIAVKTGISADRFRCELDVALLQHLQFVRSTFDRMRTRKTTNVLYRQANFNLLREESEGYAKMITDYFNASSDAFSEGSDPEMAKDAFHRIMALVGAFDLDVGRVLDITLDISAASLVRAYRFFVKFYRCSSWWPALVDNIRWTQDGPSNLPSWSAPDSGKWQYDENDRAILQQSKLERDVKFWNEARHEGMDAFLMLGARKIVDFESNLPLLEREVQSEADAKGRDITADQRKRINENRKYMRETKTLPPQGSPDAAQLLGFKLRYYASAVRGPTDDLPENIVYLAALLIKIGFISLRDLYPHLYPLDEEMHKEKSRLERDKEERDRKERPGGGMNALTMAGALADDTVPAVRNLRTDAAGAAAKSGGNTPKTDDKKEEQSPPKPPVNQKSILLRALLAIGALPEALFILGKFPWLAELDPTIAPHLNRILNQMLSKLLLTIQPMQSRTVSTKAQPVDLTANPDGTLRIAPRPKLKTRKYLGPGGPDQGDGFEEKHYYTDWDDNVPVCQDLDDFFTLSNTFLNISGVKIGKDSLLMVTIIRLAKQSLSNDISEENRTRWLDFIRRILLPALSLTKHNPGITNEMFDLLSTFSITTRFRLYEEWYTGKTSRLPEMKSAFDKNRAEVKDVLRRITNESGKKQARALAKVALSSPGIVMMTFINQLESYSNMIPGLVDSVRYFTPFAFDILTWVLIRSLSGQGRDRMQADGMLTSAWLQALSQFVASLFTRYNMIDPSPVLRYVAFELRKGDSTDLELIDQVISEMAGIRSDMNFNDVQLVAMTGGEVLQSQIVQQLADVRHQRKSSAKRLMKALSEPGIVGQVLISIAQESQMYSHRENSKYMPLKVLGNNVDKVQQVFAQYLDMLKSNTTPAEFQAVIPDVVELIGSYGLQPAVAFTISRQVIVYRKAQADAETKANAMNEDDFEANDTSIALPWHPVLQDIVNRLPAVTPSLSERVSLPFFVTFWTLTPQDVNCPLPSYEVEREKVDIQRREISKDRSDLSAAAVKEREKKAVSLEERRKQLLAEQQDRLTAVKDVRVWLNTQKKHWFGDNEDTAVRHLNVLQECFIPRALFSAIDANYCSTMLRILHSNNTPGFSLLSFLEQLFHKNLIAALIFQCTAREAENLGRFLSEVLKYMANWHSSRKTYEHEAYGVKKEHTGFATEINDGKPTAWVDYEDFRRTLFGWHNAIKDAFKTCFESGEYMQIRNGIIVLKSVVSVFPALKFHGKAMQDAVKLISDTDNRDDLKLAALSLQGPLKAREKKWVIPQDFKMSGMKETTAIDDVEMQDADKAETKLDATAPEFQPSLSVNQSRKNSTAAEDGEIEEEKPVEGTETNVEPIQEDTPSLPRSDIEPGRKESTQINGKQSREDRYGRLDRPSDIRAPASRSRSPGRDQTFERRERLASNPSDRSYHHTDHRNGTAAHPERLPQARPDVRPTERTQAPQPVVDPGRAALINGDYGDRRRTGDHAEHRSDAPTGPRAARSGRDLFEQPTRTAVETGRNRGNREASQSESSYGRLNGGPDLQSRTPSGPAQGRPQRVAQPQLNNRASELNMSDREARGPRQRSERPNTSSSNPDRAVVPATPVNDSGPAIHPSRLANLGTATPINTSVPAQTAQSPTAQPPSGPRAQAQSRRQPATPTGPSPTSNAPSAPGFSGDRQRRAERTRTGPNQAAAQPPTSTPQGVQFRGAARQSNGASEQPRAVASSMDVPPRVEGVVRVDPGRQEMIQRGQDNTRGSRTSSRERRPNNDMIPPSGPHERVQRDRRPRDDDVPPRRPPPPSAPGSFANQPQDWNVRGPPRNGYDDRSRDMQSRPEDFRPTSRRPEDGSEADGRKRRHEEGQAAFDNTKRRRNGR